jgi:DNA (cytosine-5)-methyltransferase 1
MKLTSLFDGIACFPIAYANVVGIKHSELKYDSSEVMPFLLDVIHQNFPKANQLHDITKINLSGITSNILTMGTPCTGFSISGERQGLENIESKLFRNGVQAINKLKPEYFIWENVFGVFSANEGKEFRSILDEFKSTGYDIVWTTLDAQYFGVPQRRRRVYMIGVRDGIPANHNIFSFKERSHPDLKLKAKAVIDSRTHDFNPKSTDPAKHYAIFNRQRSDYFKEVGVSSTLTKRDYKSYVDIVIKDGSIRRIVPKERLRLQGIPDNWFDGTYDKYKTDKERFMANGMAVPVVEYVFENILNKYFDGDEDMISSLISQNKNSLSSAKSAFDIHFDNKSKPLNISYSGHMRQKRNESGEQDINADCEYLLVNTCSESSEFPVESFIENILLDTVDPKFHIKIGSCEGMLKRETKSGRILPIKLKEVIFQKFPELRIKYDK